MKFEYKFTLNRALKLQEETGINIFDEDLETSQLELDKNKFIEEGQFYLENSDKISQKYYQTQDELKELHKVKCDTEEQAIEKKANRKKLNAQLKRLEERYDKEVEKVNKIYNQEIVPLENKIKLSKFKYVKTCIPFFIDEEDYYFDGLTMNDVDDFYQAKFDGLSSGYMTLIESNTEVDSDDGDKGK